jgi:branched-chain amino acid transport system substrate-binding protein
MTLAIVLLVAGLIVGGGIGYFAAPTKEVIVQGSGTTVTQTITEIPLKGATVKLGYIASTTTALETGKPHMEDICFPDINEQMAALGWGAPTFTVLLEDANGQANTHLEKVQGFLSMGVTIFQGGGWSSQAQSSLSYCNSNNILMWSSSSTSPTLSITDDYLYRMCPSDAALAPALVEVMWSYGIKSVIIFQRGDSWGDGIVNLFTPAWEAKGGDIAGEVVRYAAESTDFSNYLQQANGMATTAIAANGGNTEKVGVLLLSFDEFPVIATQCASFTPLYDCPFFGGDGTAVSTRGMDDAPEQVNHMRCFSLMAQSPESSKFNSLKARYEALTNQQYTAYSAYAYDIEFICAQSVIMAQSDAGKDVVGLQKSVSDTTWGAGGWCQLNEYGDRAPPTFNIWFCAPGTEAGTGVAVASVSWVGGNFNPDTGVTSWDTGVLNTNLGYIPAGP